jgi:hypothetical protein
MAYEDVEAIIRGTQAITDCEEQISIILDEVKNIRLWNLRADVKEFQKNCNIAKTVGTAINAVGTAIAIEYRYLKTTILI